MKDAIPSEFKAGDIPYGIAPSSFMRKLRPEYYSDSKKKPVHKLTATILEYHLETLTARNETHEFEIFCRKLCERAICPNLRPQTGPDGGGDSKTDTETFPVADEIAILTYVGEANGGRERWGFAFSAKAAWVDKIRSDVRGIIETGRRFDRIICVTSRFAKAKERARLEDELSRQHNIPVTIHDRSWIVNEVIEKKREDIAINYLDIGGSFEQEVRLGPVDYSRIQQLEDIERALSDPESFRGMERQRVTEALVAAKLSRGLERPRIETDGRFARAVRLADAEGTYRQQLEARYHLLWTAFWWHDDFEMLNASYDDFQTRALKSDHSANLEYLGNLNQLLVNTVIHGHMTREACRLDERMATLRTALNAIADDPTRPNNSLEAKTALVRLKLNVATLARDGSSLPAIWAELSDILDRANGLSEFDAEGLATFIEVAGGAAGNDRTYNDLVEKLSTFVAVRTSEAEGALVLLRRAQKLDFDDNLDMIRWLGKAVLGLSKREYSEHLIDAAQLLMLAYRSAGLLWAARATCVFAVASIYVDAEKASELPAGIVPTFKTLAWISLQLSHIPDFLFSIQMLNTFLAALPLDEASKERVRKDILELDAAFGCLLLNDIDVKNHSLKELPDILASLGLFMARTALLYKFGYAEILRKDGSLPDSMTDEDVRLFLLNLKDQPVAEELRNPLILNVDSQMYVSTILGMEISIEFKSEEEVLIAEMVAGSIEAFFATAIDRGILPHTESVRIQICRNDSGEPSIEINEIEMEARIYWPKKLSASNFDRQSDICKFMIECCLHIIGAACAVTSDTKSVVEALFNDEAVHHRVTMIVVAPNSYGRMASRPYFRLSDWQYLVTRSYPMREDQPELKVSPPKERSDEVPAQATEVPGKFNLNNHQAMKVHSVIDVPVWDGAKWRGCGYVQRSKQYPMVMALLFENMEAGKRIFEKWKQRIGGEDKSDDIVLSIIRGLPESSPHHYCVQISAKLPDSTDTKANRVLLTSSRSMIMEPSNSLNLEAFLESYRRFGAYFLVPASPAALAEFPKDLVILKRDVRVMLVSEISETDPEAAALHAHKIKRLY